MNEDIILGVDAGGTRTRCIVATIDGAVLGRAEGAAANVAANRTGAATSLRETAAEALRQAGIAGPVAVACAGIAGYSALGEGHAEALFHQVAAAGEWCVHPDLHIAWAGGTGGKPGVAVIGGTGSVAYGRNAEGHEHRCGGWGYLLGDEGSAFWIGREALNAVLRYHDGRGPMTALVRLIEESVGESGPRAIIRYAYREGRSTSEFARFAPLVTQACDSGDFVAVDILAAAGRHLAELGATTIRVLGLGSGEFPVVTVGGAFRAKSHLLREFEAGILAAAPHAHVSRPRYVPVAGALILAMEIAGHPPDDATLARLDSALSADLA